MNDCHVVNWNGADTKYIYEYTTNFKSTDFSANKFEFHADNTELQVNTLCRMYIKAILRLIERERTDRSTKKDFYLLWPQQRIIFTVT